MPKQINIGAQNFKELLESGAFYVDKTAFIKEWWRNLDTVTLIARPRRFGKTLNMSMLDCFFSNKYAGGAQLFNGLKISEDEQMMELQGTYPVMNLSLSSIKENTYHKAILRIKSMIARLYEENRFLMEADLLSSAEKKYFEDICLREMEETEYVDSLNILSAFLYRYYRKKVIILLDEYDTPLQEAYVNGYWDEMTAFVRSFFNATLKANEYLERGLLTGITRVSKESIFSDLNNLEVITISSTKYADSFGFTQTEVEQTLTYFGLEDQQQKVEKWYDGFLFGESTIIYNPWSMINYLDKKKFMPYWANTSSNSLIGKLVRQGNEEIKQQLLDLMQGQSLSVRIDEQIMYDQLDDNEEAIWSLMVATGYLKILKIEDIDKYELKLTNYEVESMFKGMIRNWFSRTSSNYNRFVNALLKSNVKEMNIYMNRVALNTISYFDSGKNPSEDSEPERFYHGFVLGLMVELEDSYAITSNRESGFGRYDIMLEPRSDGNPGIILEFKVIDRTEEADLNETAKSALQQIEDKKYEAALNAKGISDIRKYGFCFEGKTVLIVQG